MDKDKIAAFVEEALENTDCFLTDVTVSKDNDIVVEIDSMGSVDIDFCGALSRRIEEAFPRDEEDYTLEVGSAGLTAPFKVLGQWEKNLGNRIEVLTTEGRKLAGVLKELTEEDFTLEYSRKVKHEGMKRPVLETVTEQIPFSEVKRANWEFSI